MNRNAANYKVKSKNRGKGNEPLDASYKFLHLSQIAVAAICCLAAKSCPTVATPWTVARQAPLSMGFSRQEHWNGLPCPPPGDLLDPGIGSKSLISPALTGGFFTTSTTLDCVGFLFGLSSSPPSQAV